MTHTALKALSNRRPFTIVEFYFDRNDPALDATFALEANSCATPKTTDNALAYTGDDFFVYRYADTQVFGIDHFPNLMSVNSVPPKVEAGKSIGFRATATVKLKDFISNDEFEIPTAYTGREVTGSHLTKLLSRVHYKNRRAVIIRGFDPSNYDANNVTKEHYLIDKFTLPDENGFSNISLVDEFILIEKDKSKMPVLSAALLNGAINDAVTTINFTSTITDEFGTTGNTGYIRIDEEAMSYTVGTPTTQLTVVREVLGTTKAAHSDGAAVQESLYFNNTNALSIVAFAINNYTNIDGSQYIDAGEWITLEGGEMSTYLYTNLITRPTSVKDIINQMIRLTGMSMYINIIDQKIEVVPVPRFFEPIISFNEGEHFSRGTIKVTTDYKKQITRQRIIWNKKDYANDSSNESDYLADYEYIDLVPEAAADEWNTSEGKLLKTNWLDDSVDHKTLANNFALKEVGRFSVPPKRITFDVDERWIGEVSGGFMWLGSVFQVLTNRLVDQFLVPIATACQCTSIARSKVDGQYTVTGLSYNAEVPPDEEFYVFSSLTQNANLRTIYDADPSLGPAAADTKVTFIIDYSVVVGATSNLTFAIDTGSWPAGAIVTLKLNPNSFLVGKGGDGAGSVSGAAEAGGPALLLNYDLTLDNSGTIGVGGGGGGRAQSPNQTASGGGGAGNSPGIAGTVTTNAYAEAEDGTTSSGGNGALVYTNAVAFGGNGGDLGQAGTDGELPFGVGTITSGAAAGYAAIDKNGFTLTEANLGTVIGPIIA